MRQVGIVFLVVSMLATIPHVDAGTVQVGTMWGFERNTDTGDETARLAVSGKCESSDARRMRCHFTSLAQSPGSLLSGGRCYINSWSEDFEYGSASEAGSVWRGASEGLRSRTQTTLRMPRAAQGLGWSYDSFQLIEPQPLAPEGARVATRVSDRNRTQTLRCSDVNFLLN